MIPNVEIDLRTSSLRALQSGRGNPSFSLNEGERTGLLRRLAMTGDGAIAMIVVLTPSKTTENLKVGK